MPTAGQARSQWGIAIGTWASGSAQGLSAVHVAGDGWLHKVVSVGPGVHIIEELQIFSSGQPVQNLLLDADRVSRGGVRAACLGCLTPAPAGWRDPGSWYKRSECGGPGA